MPLLDGHEDLMRLSAVAPQLRTRIEQAAFTYYEPRNEARTVRGYGFRAVCPGCDPFPVVASYSMARAALREHVASVHRDDEA